MHFELHLAKHIFISSNILDENYQYLQLLLLLTMHMEAAVQPDWHKRETEAAHLLHTSHSCQNIDLRSALCASRREGHAAFIFLAHK